MAKIPLKLLPADHYRKVYYQDKAALGTVPDDLLVPGYWANVARDLRPCDEIIVMPEDMAWRAHVFVQAAGRNEAVVRMLSVVMLDEVAEVAEDAVYEVKWRGPARKFSVVKRADGAVVKEDFPVREQAAKWMQSHMTAMAR